MLHVYSALYIATFIACISYLNRARHQEWMFIVAFAITGAGSFGSCVDLWADSPHSEFFHVLYPVGITSIIWLHFGFDRRKSAERRGPFERKLL